HNTRLISVDQPPIDVPISGGGYIAYQGDQKVISGKFRLHNFAAAVNAEITAIADGIEAVIRSCPIHFARNLIVFSDSKTAVDIGNGRIPSTSQVQALRIRQFQKDWLLRRRLPHLALGTVIFEWISGHYNNLGNDIADRLASYRPLLHMATPTPHPRKSQGH
ncbi:hypothetical protein EPUL_006467, partial [Erysiphe pulchra]